MADIVFSGRVISHRARSARSGSRLPCELVDLDLEEADIRRAAALGGCGAGVVRARAEVGAVGGGGQICRSGGEEKRRRGGEGGRHSRDLLSAEPA